jgi:hypothetical protein
LTNGSESPSAMWGKGQYLSPTPTQVSVSSLPNGTGGSLSAGLDKSSDIFPQACQYFQLRDPSFGKHLTPSDSLGLAGEVTEREEKQPRRQIFF